MLILKFNLPTLDFLGIVALILPCFLSILYICMCEARRRKPEVEKSCRNKSAKRVKNIIGFTILFVTMGLISTIDLMANPLLLYLLLGIIAACAIYLLYVCVIVGWFINDPLYINRMAAMKKGENPDDALDSWGGLPWERRNNFW